MPEVNADAVAGFRKKGIISATIPNCSTAQLVVALKPLHDKAQDQRVVVVVINWSRAPAKEVMDQVFAQDEGRLHHGRGGVQEVSQAHGLQRYLLHIVFMDDGFTKEEWKMVVETKKIFSTPRSSWSRPACGCRCSSAIRKPSTSSSRTRSRRTRHASGRATRRVLRPAIDKRELVLRHALRGGGRGCDLYQPHPREGPTVDNGLVPRCVSDNLRKGAALNAIQIAVNCNSDPGQAQGGMIRNCRLGRTLCETNISAGKCWVS